MSQSKLNRRTFLRRSVAASAVLPLGAIPISLIAQDNQVSEDDPAAAALGYKHDASTVDTAKYPQKQDGQHCANCKLYTGADGDEWGGCGIFPGKQVNAEGWCAAWVTSG